MQDNQNTAVKVVQLSEVNQAIWEASIIPGAPIHTISDIPAQTYLDAIKTQTIDHDIDLAGLSTFNVGFARPGSSVTESLLVSAYGDRSGPPKELLTFLTGGVTNSIQSTSLKWFETR